MLRSFVFAALLASALSAHAQSNSNNSTNGGGKQDPSQCKFTQRFDVVTSRCVDIPCGPGYELKGSACSPIQLDCSGDNKPAACNVPTTCTARPGTETKKWIALTFEGGPL
jgi:hypothetical protein